MLLPPPLVANKPNSNLALLKPDLKLHSFWPGFHVRLKQIFDKGPTLQLVVECPTKIAERLGGMCPYSLNSTVG